MARILTVTLNPTIDVSSEAETVRPTRKTRLQSTRHEPGGGGINVARLIHELGGDAQALFLCGGEVGSFLCRLLAEEQVGSRAFAIAGQTRLAFTVRERSTGLEYRFVPEGPEVHETELKPLLDAIAADSAAYVVASGSLPSGAPPDTFARMAVIAEARGARFVLDTSGEALRLTLKQARPFLVKPSRGELETLAGRPLDEAGLAAMAATLVADGSAHAVAVTLGADGAILASAAGVLRLPAIHVRVRSAVGAGDSFLGAMVWALAAGLTLEAAFKHGMAAGAAAAMTPGTRLCRRADVEALRQRLP